MIFSTLKRLKKFGKHIGKNKLRVTLCDINKELLDNLCRVFSGYQEVEIIQGNLIKIKCDAIVSPANSFGDMGGGVDKIIDDFYEGHAQNMLSQKIRKEFYGELPVGMAVVIRPTPNKPFLICSPTMRIPGNVSNSINAYLSMRAALVAAIKHNIRHIAVPGLGSGVGGIPYPEVALQMGAAYENIVLQKWRAILHPAQAPFVNR